MKYSFPSQLKIKDAVILLNIVIIKLFSDIFYSLDV